MSNAPHGRSGLLPQLAVADEATMVRVAGTAEEREGSKFRGRERQRDVRRALGSMVESPSPKTRRGTAAA